MSQQPDALAADGQSDGEIMAAIEEDEALVIADISRDNAYLSMPVAEAASLSAWR
ncbi:DUF7556 family protein [Halorhabdus salina]|uniref:DUF7556 family protein n=1 Tax=Halorhabdus salina TaxID=2750670 RepID=UPI0015EFD9C6|nr:hypothetical protein [Halorhabdus salina]